MGWNVDVEYLSKVWGLMEVYKVIRVWMVIKIVGIFVILFRDGVMVRYGCNFVKFIV